MKLAPVILFVYRRDVKKTIDSLLNNNLANQTDLFIYSDGSNIRDWIYVEDHCKAISLILEKGKPGEEYCIGGSNEMSNLEICKLILEIIDTLIPCKNNNKYINYKYLILSYLNGIMRPQHLDEWCDHL